METFNEDPKPGRLVLPLVLIGMIATTYTFINRVAENNNLEIEHTVEVVTEEVDEEPTTEDTTTTTTTTPGTCCAGDACSKVCHQIFQCNYYT